MSQEQKERSEQRKYQRVAAHVPVKYRKLSDPWSEMKDGTVTSNLSKGGVNFRTKEFMPKAGRIVMEIDVPERKPLKAISRVAWILRSQHGDDYDVGNQFLEMSREDKDVFFSFIDELTAKSA
jgi:c-di-GMP-binding flagellar brake protein YcgR